VEQESKPVSIMSVQRQVGVGTIINALILLAGLGTMYGQFSAKFDAYGKAVERTEKQTARIEHYLSAKDPAYWRKVAQNGDNQ
jgi:hypothetical protein